MNLTVDMVLILIATRLKIGPIRVLGEHTARIRLTIDMVPSVTIVVHREGEIPFAGEEAKAETTANPETKAEVQPEVEIKAEVDPEVETEA